MSVVSSQTPSITASEVSFSPLIPKCVTEGPLCWFGPIRPVQFRCLVHSVGLISSFVLEFSSNAVGASRMLKEV